MQQKIAQIIIAPGARASTAAEIFISEPEASKIKLAGKAFAIIEVASKKTSDLKLLNFIIESFNRLYYQDEKMVLRQRNEEIKVEHIFESTLAKLNKEISSFIKQSGNAFLPSAWSATLGVACGNDLYFSNFGRNHVFILSPKKNFPEKYELTDLFESGENNANLLENEKMFTSILSGSLSKDGSAFFANEAMAEYLSRDQILNIVSALPPLNAAEQIKNLLAKINNYISFLGIIIKNTQQEDTAAWTEKASVPADSISRLKSMETETEDILFAGSRFGLKSLLAAWKRRKEKPKAPSQPLALKKNLSEKIADAGGKIKNARFSRLLSLLHLPRSLFSFSKSIFAGFLLGSRLRPLRRSFSEASGNGGKRVNPENQNASSPIAVSDNRETQVRETPIAAKKISGWWKNLSRKNRTILSLALASLLIFSVNIFWLGGKNKKEEKLVNYEELVRTIEQKESQVESALLYNNQESARKLLGEIKGLLVLLPEEEETIIKRAELETKYNVYLDKTSLIERLDNPEKIIDFNETNPGASPSRLDLAAGKILADDAERKTIYAYNLKTKASETPIKTEGNPAKTLFSAADGNRAYYLFGDGSLAALRADINAWEKINGQVKNPTSVKGLAAYNGKLYALDAADNQIYAYGVSAGRLAAPAAWLKEKATFGNASGLALDGNIYITEANGAINKYFKGYKQEFMFGTVEPALLESAKIATSRESEFLYILDKKEKRIIAFDKNGKLAKQYKSKIWNDLRDIALSENGQELFALDGTTVYRIK